MAFNKSLIPFYSYLKGKKILERDDADHILATSGQYPKYIEPPVDMEYNKETRTYEAFFNLEKRLRFHKLDWVLEKFPKLVLFLDERTMNNAFLAKQSDKLHDKLMSYNSKTPSGQFAEDLKISLRKSIAGATAIFVALLLLVFGILPSVLSSGGERAFDKGDYKAAYSYFQKTPSSYADKMEQLSLMNVKIEEGKKDEALKIAGKLEGIPISSKYKTDTLKREVYYKTARIHEDAKEYFEAASNYKNAGDYMDAQQRLIKNGYKAYKPLLKEGKHREIISVFVYLVGYQDSEDLLLNSMEVYYQEGLTHFNNGDLEKASEIFTFLSKYKYKNATTMLSETTYLNGRTAMNEGNYAKAIEEFEKVIGFKDASSWYKEAHYASASQKILTEPFAALQHLLKSYNYKESNKLLMSGHIVIYGVWRVVEVDGATTAPSQFKFSSDNRLTVIEDEAKQLDGLFDTDQSYALNGSTFQAGDYSLETIEVTDINSIKVRVQGKTLTLKRQQSIALMKAEQTTLVVQDLVDAYFGKIETAEEPPPTSAPSSSQEDAFELEETPSSSDDFEL